MIPLQSDLTVMLRALPSGWAFHGQVDGHLSARWGLSKDAYTEDDVKPGTPYVILTIRVTNGSKKSIEVGNYEEVMTYGKDGEKAPSVQDEGIESIDGKVLPGRSRTGTYGWVVAKKDRKDVQLEFEWDASDDCCEDAALFVGPLTA